jgi:excisionase family DNA binding protein
MTDQTGNADALLTADQVAEWLQVAVGTVQQWAKAGRIPVVKVGALNRFRRSDIEAWIEQRTRASEPAKASA